MKLSQIVEVIHQNAKAHGWWETERPQHEIMLLIVCEVAELFEAFRKGLLHSTCDKHIPVWTMDGEAEVSSLMTNLEEETADIVIRLLDFCGRHGITPAERADIVRNPTSYDGAFSAYCMEAVNIATVMSHCDPTRWPLLAASLIDVCKFILALGRQLDPVKRDCRLPDLWTCVMAKHEFNKSRPYRHGNLRA